MRIAIDAMGGDRAPSVVIEGAVRVLRDKRCPSDAEFLLVGDKEQITRELDRLRVKPENRGRLIIEHASEAIAMAETAPVSAVRQQKDSSIAVAVRALKEGRADAFVSAGNTGAVMAASTLGLGRMAGIDRPAIATVMPTLRSYMVLLDIGANIECKPENLLQFAVMGSVYANFAFHIDSPSIGLLSNGEEQGKGTALVREAYKLLAVEKRLNFYGNVEGRDLSKGTTDVVVTDGFLGNVILKYGEGLGQGLGSMFKAEIMRSPLGRIGAALFLRGPMERFKKKVDYTEFGGAPLLGLKKPCFICHGSSSAKSIKSALVVAMDFVRADVNDKIKRTLAEAHAETKIAANQ